MTRCGHHDVLNQCPRAAVITIMAVTGVEPLEETTEWCGDACVDHAWEATATAAHRVRRARAEGHSDARIVALVSEAGEQLLKLLQMGVTLGDRWPLAEPWVRP